MSTKVMIVDDESTIVALCATILGKKGFEVVGTALDGEVAIQKVMEMAEPPDLVLLDHRMPGKSGLDTMKELLRIRPAIRVMFMTADETVRSAALQNGACGFLTKPFGVKALLEAVEAALGHRS